MNHPHNHFATLILAAAVTLVIGVLYIYMFYATNASVNQADLARDIVRVEMSDQSQSKSLSQLASSTAASRAHLNSFFVPADDVVTFITSLESIGGESGSSLSLASIDADSLDGKPAGTIGTVRAHIDADGSWSSVMRALAIAENMPYAVSIDQVQLNASTGQNGRSTWNLSFDIQAAMIVLAPASK